MPQVCISGLHCAQLFCTLSSGFKKAHQNTTYMEEELSSVGEMGILLYPQASYDW